MAIVNITCENDADFVCGFVYQYESGTPIDLTGNTMRMGIRRRAEEVIEDMLLTTENGGIAITDAINGKFTVFIAKKQLLELDLGDYEHSLIRDTGGNLLRIWSGTLTNNAGPSR